MGILKIWDILDRPAQELIIELLHTSDGCVPLELLENAIGSSAVTTVARGLVALGWIELDGEFVALADGFMIAALSLPEGSLR